MSTNHTPNFNLCQWEATDKVLRADFNQDNAKIDAALAGLDSILAGKLGKPEVLFDTATEFPGQTWGGIRFNLNWSDWEFVVATAHFPEKTSDKPDTLDHFILGIGEHIGVKHLIASMPYGDTAMILWPHHDGTRPFQGILLGERAVPFLLSSPFDHLHQYSFSSTVGRSGDASETMHFGIR